MAKSTRKTAILDAAERLFSAMAYDGVTMRMIAEAAPVGLGLLTHHFATKEALFEAVIARRADALTAARRAALEPLVDPTLEDLLLAFAGPYRDLIDHGGEGWRHYAHLIAQVTSDARWTELMARHFSDLGREMIVRIRQAEPALDDDLAVRGYVHIVSILVGLFASSGLVDKFSDGRLSSDDFDAGVDPMIRFAAGGIRALAGPK